MTVGELIRREREGRHWSRAELARRAGVSAVLVGRIEEGESGGRAQSIARLGDALGLDAILLGDAVAASRDQGAVYRASLAGIAPEMRDAAREGLDAFLSALRKNTPTVKDSPSGDPPPDSQRLGEVAVAHKAPSYMAVA